MSISGPEPNQNPDEQGPNASSDQDRELWLDWLFPPGVPIASPHAVWMPNGPLGSSRLANSRELQELVTAATARPSDYLRLLPAYGIGHDPQPKPVNLGGFPIPLGLDSPNLLCFGRSGSGKTQKVTLPAGLHAIAQGWSVFYVNIKGRRQTKWLRYFAQKANRQSEVTLLAPRQPSLTAGCSLLEECHDLARAKEMAAIMVAAVAGRSRHDGGAWAYNQAEEWLQNYLCAIKQDLLEESQTLLQLRKTVLAADYAAAAKQHPAFPALRRFAQSYETGNTNTGTITSTISEATAFIDDVAGFLSVDEFRFADFARQGGIVILEINQSDIKALRTLVTLLLGRAMGALQREACSNATGRVPNKTVVIIDELMSTEALPGMQECLHTCREQGFGFIAGTQSIAQLSTIFGSDWLSVLDGFQTQIAMGSALDEYTAQHFSQRSGMGTIALPTVNDPQDAGPIVTGTWQLTPRPPLLPSDINGALRHPELGCPATVIMGDGATPMFQVYLTSAYEEPTLQQWMELAVEQPDEAESRLTPLAITMQAAPISQGGTRVPRRPLTLQERREVRKRLNYSAASPAVQVWWRYLEEMNPDKILVNSLYEVLLERQATVAEFHRAWTQSDAINADAALHYMQFLRCQEKTAEKQKPK